MKIGLSPFRYRCVSMENFEVVIWGVFVGEKSVTIPEPTRLGVFNIRFGFDDLSRLLLFNRLVVRLVLPAFVAVHYFLAVAVQLQLPRLLWLVIAGGHSASSSIEMLVTNASS